MYANKIKVTVLESDASQIHLLRKYGYKVFMAMPRKSICCAAGADKAEALVICTDSPDEVMAIVDICRTHFPNLKLLARAQAELRPIS